MQGKDFIALVVKQELKSRSMAWSATGFSLLALTLRVWLFILLRSVSMVKLVNKVFTIASVVSWIL